MTDAVIERYVYDVVLQFDGDQAGDLTHRFLHGPAVDQILAQEDVSENISDPDRVLWHLADNLGTVRDLAKNDATLGEHYEYDSFGNVVSGDASVTRYLFTGREFDPDTGLQYNRARWYDAAVGRWISEDPIGFESGDPNLARYVMNSPTFFTDPSGLETEADASARWALEFDAGAFAPGVPGDTGSMLDNYSEWFNETFGYGGISEDLGALLYDGISAIPGGEAHLAEMSDLEALGWTVAVAIPTGFALLYGGEIVLGVGTFGTEATAIAASEFLAEEIIEEAVTQVTGLPIVIVPDPADLVQIPLREVRRHADEAAEAAADAVRRADPPMPNCFVAGTMVVIPNANPSLVENAETPAFRNSTRIAVSAGVAGVTFAIHALYRRRAKRRAVEIHDAIFAENDFQFCKFNAN